MINPMELLNLKNQVKQFFKDHPKVRPFIRTAFPRLTPGAVVEVTIRPVNGTDPMRMNIKLNSSDIETLKKVREVLR